jgi:hypothetical protein
VDTAAAQILDKVATQLDSEANIAARPGQTERLEDIATVLRDLADILRGDQ